MPLAPRGNSADGKAPGWTLPLLLILTLVAGCEKQDSIVVDSKPAGASVWVGSRILGPAPQDVAVPENLGLRIRVASPGYQDWERRFAPDELIDGKTYRIELRPRELLSVWFRSTPSDAEVRVNGELRGRTPLLLGDLAPGVLSVVISAAGRESVRRSLELEPGEDARNVAVTLPGLTEDIYRQRISETPGDLQNYADLGHYLVLQHRFKEAASVLGAGMRLHLTDKAAEGAKRLTQELRRIPSEQFDYGTGQQVRQAREALCAELQTLVKDYPKAGVPVYRTLIQLLLQTRQIEQARETAEQAAVLYPDDRHIQRYKRRIARPNR